jgi:hypothetical protein
MGNLILTNTKRKETHRGGFRLRLISPSYRKELKGPAAAFGPSFHLLGRLFPFLLFFNHDAPNSIYTELG